MNHDEALPPVPPHSDEAQQEADEEATRASSAQASRSLDKSLLMGLAWTGGMKWATQVISWASTIVVARLLTPDDYGVMGMAMVYVNLVALVNEFGLTAAILTRRDLGSDDIARIGGFGICVGAFFTLISLGLATPIGLFYGDPAVRMVIVLLSANFLISAIGVLPKALLARDLQFHRLAIIDGVTSITQVAVTLVLALLGFRYFSLVFGSIASAVAGVGLATLWHGHRIKLPRPFKSIRSSINIGWHVVIGRIAWYTYQNADFAIVGRVLGKTVLGAYTLGWEIATVPVERISVLVGQVTPSIFSSVQHDRPALRRYFLAIVGGLAFITFPAAIGIALTADLLVPIVLGERWISAIVPMQFLAAYAGIRSIDTVGPQILVFTGHSRQSMWFSIMAACTFPLAFLFATRWGASGVAATWVVAYPIIMFPIYRLLFRVLEMRARTYFANLWPAISSTLVMAAAVLVARPWLRANSVPYIALIAEVLVGIIVYAAMMWFAHRDRLMSFKNIIQTARS